jgi:hypothetical protein
VRALWRRAGEGASLGDLRKWVVGLPDEVRGGRTAPITALRYLLASPVYVSRQPSGDNDVLSRPVCRWPPLVDDATWQRVNERLAMMPRGWTKASPRYLLTGFLRCPSCGRAMTGHTAQAHSPRYQCVWRRRSAFACFETAVAGLVDAAVLDAVKQLVRRVASIADRATSSDYERWRVLQLAARTSPAALREAEIRAERDAALDVWRGAARSLVDGRATRSHYEAVRAEATQRIKDANARLHAASPGELPHLREVLERARRWRSALDGGDLTAHRTVLRELVTQVTPRRTGYGRYAAEITRTTLANALRIFADESQGPPPSGSD